MREVISNKCQSKYLLIKWADKKERVSWRGVGIIDTVLADSRDLNSLSLWTDIYQSQLDGSCVILVSSSGRGWQALILSPLRHNSNIYHM